MNASFKKYRYGLGPALLLGGQALSQSVGVFDRPACRLSAGRCRIPATEQQT